MKNNIELSQPLADVLTDYLFSRKSENLRQATIDNYRFHLTTFMRYMLENQIDDIENVTAAFIRRYKVHQKESGLKDSSIDAHHRCLATFFQWLLDEELISNNPMSKVKKTKFDVKRKPAFTREDVRKLWSACKNDLERSMIILLLDSGLRVGEVVNLQIKDVDLLRGLVSVENTKGRVDRTVGITTKTGSALRRMLKNRRKETNEDDYLFVNRSGNQFTTSGFRQVFDKLKERAGVTTEGSLHGLRRTCLTTLATNGCDLPTIQKISGHKNVSTLIERYIAVDDEVMRKAVKEKGAVNSLLP